MDSRHVLIQGLWAYSAQRLAAQGKLIIGSEVTLWREPDNKHDSNAASVYLGNNKLGYLPRHTAAELASYFDKGGTYAGTISKLGSRKFRGKTNVTIYLDLILHDLRPPKGLEELKKSASLLKGCRGVYVITNTVEERSYVGSSSGVGERLGSHIANLRNGSHSNSGLSEAWRNHGPMGFSFSLLESVPHNSPLNERERFYIKKLNTYDGGYNQTLDGQSATPLPDSKRHLIGPKETLGFADIHRPRDLSQSASRFGCVIPIVIGFVSMIGFIAGISLIV